MFCLSWQPPAGLVEFDSGCGIVSQGVLLKCVRLLTVALGAARKGPLGYIKKQDGGTYSHTPFLHSARFDDPETCPGDARSASRPVCVSISRCGSAWVMVRRAWGPGDEKKRR